MAPSSLITQMELPDHILHQVIMPKLSFKVITRFKGISKETLQITKDNQFVAYQARSAVASSSCFLYTTPSGLSFIPDTGLIGIPDPSLNFLKPTSSEIRLHSSTNGLILFSGEFHGMTSLCVCNPATQDMSIIPHDCIETFFQVDMGLAFDPCKYPNRYTVVEPILHSQGLDLMCCFNVFRSETGKWTRSCRNVHVDWFFTGSTPVCATGVIYWNSENGTYLLWFDTERDVAGTTPLPDRGGKTEVGVCAGDIMYYRTWTGGIEVWKLTKGSHWVKIYATNWDCMVNASECCHGMQLRSTSKSETFFERRYVRPIGFDGRFVYIAVRMRSKDATEKLYSWDTETGRVHEKGQIAVNKPYDVVSQVFSYVNSMVRVPQVLNGASN